MGASGFLLWSVFLELDLAVIDIAMLPHINTISTSTLKFQSHAYIFKISVKVVEEVVH
jgi:hypothetical protein